MMFWIILAYWIGYLDGKIDGKMEAVNHILQGQSRALKEAIRGGG